MLNKKCSECGMEVRFTEQDKRINTNRLTELMELQEVMGKKGKHIDFKFRATCDKCGVIYFSKMPKVKKV